MIHVIESEDYIRWFQSLTVKEQLQVASRLERIKFQEHFGDAKYLGDGLSELRWKSGWRIYFSKIDYNKIILIIGGHKNEQEKNIKKARLFIRRHAKY